MLGRPRESGARTNPRWLAGHMLDIPEISDWSARFAAESLVETQVEAFVTAIDREIMKAIPEIARDPVLVEELHASTRAHWRSFLVGLGDDYRLALPPAATALSESIARRQLDINVLLKVYRVAHTGVFDYLTERTRTGLPATLSRDEALIHLWTRAARWMNDSVESLIESYTAERQRAQEGALARRAEAVQALLDGAAASAELEQAIGHRLSGWQTAFVLWADSPSGDDLPISDLAVRTCRALGLSVPLTTLVGSRELCGWAATSQEPDLALDAPVDLLREHGLRLAVGRPQRGAVGFRVSHQQARAAQQLGLEGALPTVLDHAAVELLAFLGVHDLAREMVRRELGPLLGADRQTVRATVLTFLRSGRDVDATAGALFVHPNTVRYRLARAEDLLGAPVAARATVLELCLSWVELFGAEDLVAD